MIDIRTSPDVYEPREDSFLFVEHLDSILSSQPLTILEIGTGTGIIILNLMANYDHSCNFAVDLNIEAAQLTKKNAELNELDNLQIIVTNGFSPFRQIQFDLAIFNPPYLPEDEFLGSMTKMENIQYIGGKFGYEVLSDMLNKYRRFYKRFITMISSLSITPREFSSLHSDYRIKVISEKKIPFETLWLLMIEVKTNE